MTELHPRSQQFLHLAFVQAWELVVHTIAVHHGDKSAAKQLSTNIRALAASGGSEQVMRALADVTARAIGDNMEQALAALKALDERTAFSGTVADGYKDGPS